MNLNRFCIKFFARPETKIDDSVFIDLFHEWIRLKTLPGTLLDVADYRHVPEGPGIMLITHEINFAMDYSYGRFGLYAQRKLGAAERHQDRILELVRATALFGSLLESDARVAGRVRLEAGSFHYQANDRLQASNTAETYTALKPDLVAAAEVIYPGQAVSLNWVDNDPRDRLTIAVAGPPVTMQVLADTVGVMA